MSLKNKVFPLICLAGVAAMLAFAFVGNAESVSKRIGSLLPDLRGGESSEGFRDARKLMADPKVGQLLTGNTSKKKTDPQHKELALANQPSSDTLRLLKVLSSAQSRVPGYPGYEATSSELINIFNGIFGAQNVTVEEFPVTVPVTLYSRLILHKSGKRFEDQVHPLWPHNVKLHTFAGGAAEGLVVDGGNGSAKALDGKTIRDAFVLMRFDSDDAYLRVRQLGARAVILLSQGEISYHQALLKFCNVPVDAPLFFAQPEATEALLAAAAKGESIRLETRSEWREVKARNIWGRFPGAKGKLPIPIKEEDWTNEKWDQNNILVNSFYDSMSIVPDRAPGASSAAGLLGLVECARYVKTQRDLGKPNQHGIVFLANGAHFLDLQGISHFMFRHARGEKHPLRRKIPESQRIEPRLTLSLEMTDAVPRVAVSQIGLGIAESPWYRHENQREMFAPWLQRIFFAFRDACESVYGDASNRVVDGIRPSGRNYRSLFPVEHNLAFDSDVINFMGHNAAALTTPDDTRQRVDTPIDTFDQFNLQNVMEQARAIAPPIYLVSRDASAFSKMNLKGTGDLAKSISGRAVWYDVKSSFSTPVGRIGEGGLAVYSTIQSHVPTRHGVRVGRVQRLRFNAPKGGNERKGFATSMSSETAWRLHVSKTQLGLLDYVSSEEIQALPLEAVYRDRNGALKTVSFEGKGTEYFATVPRDARQIERVVLKSAKGERVLFGEGALHETLLHEADFDLDVGVLRYATLEVWSDDLGKEEEIIVSMGMRGPQQLSRPMQYDAQASERRKQPTYSTLLDSESLGVREIARISKQNRETLFANIQFEDTFRFDVLTQALQADWARAKITCYRLNGDGAIDFAMDEGHQGTQSYDNTVYNVPGFETELLGVLFPCRAVSLFDIIDSRYLRALDVMRVLSTDDSEPIRYGESIWGKQSIDERHVPLAAVAFVDPTAPLKLLMSSDFFGIKYLLINTPDQYIDAKYLKKTPEGPRTELPADVENIKPKGYPASESILFNPAYQVARDMWLLDESRARKLSRYGVRNERLDALHADAYVELIKAKTALQEKNYSEYFRASHEAWGLEARAYPDVKGTAIDTVKGIIFYFALLLPFSFFLERLLFGFTDFRKQVAGICVMFFLAFILLRYVHPAFKISDSPYVILLAFIILVLGVIVTLTIALKFRGEIQKMKSEASGVIETDVGRLSATYSAVILGVSNLRKRKVRTALTATTVCLLTFTVLSFTSVTHQLDFWRIPVDPDFAPHTGALVRDRNYRSMQPHAYEMLREAFAGKARVLRRSWMIFDFNYNELCYYELKNPTKGTSAIANAFLGLEPEEANLPLGYKQADGKQQKGAIQDILVKDSRWFSTNERASNVILLPEFLAKSLQITPEEVKAGTASVQLFNESFAVVGIFDEEIADRARFLDNEPIMPLDISAAPKEEREKTLRMNPAESGAKMIDVLPHLPARTVPILPYERVQKWGHGPRHLAVYDFTEPDKALVQVKDFMRRVSLAVYVGDGKSIQVYSTMGSPSFSGLSKLFVPILIVAALVMNTMMGAVYERFKEIGIYSSVGLAPNHIGALFLAESFVFATVGAVIGYLISQALAFGLSSAGLLSGINLNYSSLSAVLATLIVMVTVLASSLYPARKASQMAVPDVTRRWKIVPPESDTWRFLFPFTIAGTDVAGLNVFLRDYFQAYIDNSVADFFTQGVKLEEFADPNGRGTAYRLSMNIWLAPYDMSISQHLVLESLPTEYHNVYEVHVTLERMSGEFSSWVKMNRRFLNILRKRFLLWRTIPQATKERYAQALTEPATLV